MKHTHAFAVVETFEKIVAEYTGAKYAVAVERSKNPIQRSNPTGTKPEYETKLNLTKNIHPLTERN